MKKTIKKLSVVVTLTAMMSLSLAGCSKKTECEVCGEVKKCNKYEITVDGKSETGYLCKDCYDLTKGLVNLTGGKIKKK